MLRRMRRSLPQVTSSGGTITTNNWQRETTINIEYEPFQTNYDLEWKSIHSVVQNAVASVHNRKIDALVAAHFSLIPEVKYVYRENDGDIARYFVFTSNDVYDDALMERLLNREIGIIHATPDLLADFQYIPHGLYSIAADAVSSAAEIIFERK